jgi:hypothetical protein
MSPEGGRLLPYTGQGARALDDAVDEAIEWVMDTGSEILSCASHDLDVHQKIAAGLRHGAAPSHDTLNRLLSRRPR